LLDIQNIEDCKEAMLSIGVTSTGSQIMKKKTLIYNILINNISTTEALIIKQEMLARGGDAALPREAVSHETQKVSLIISGTQLQVERLINKIRRQVRELPAIADMLTELMNKNNDTLFRYSR